MLDHQALHAAYLCKEVYDHGTCVDDLCFLVNENDGWTHVAIRGTNNKENVRRDLDVYPPAFDGVYPGHRGCITGARLLLKNGILNQIPKNKPVQFDGHSLAGGIILPLARMLNAPAVSFGGMRVYIRGCVPKDLQHYRIVTDDDPVPHLPPGIMHDHGREPWMVLRDRDHELIDVKDHSIDVYIARLEKMLNYTAADCMTKGEWTP